MKIPVFGFFLKMSDINMAISRLELSDSGRRELFTNICNIYSTELQTSFYATCCHPIHVIARIEYDIMLYNS